MARRFADTEVLYRAVIVKSWQDGYTTTSIHGPFLTAAPAKGAITRAKQIADTANKRLAIDSQWSSPRGAQTVIATLEKTKTDWQPA